MYGSPKVAPMPSEDRDEPYSIQSHYKQRSILFTPSGSARPARAIVCNAGVKNGLGGVRARELLLGRVIWQLHDIRRAFGSRTILDPRPQLGEQALRLCGWLAEPATAVAHSGDGEDAIEVVSIRLPLEHVSVIVQGEVRRDGGIGLGWACQPASVSRTSKDPSGTGAGG